MKKILIIAPILLLVSNLYSFTDLGKWGQMYEINEHIKWKDHNNSIITKARIKDAIKNAMTSKEKLPTCSKNSTWTFDPTVTLKKTISIPKYNIHIPAGSKFNPLDYGTETKYMVLINGKDSNQTKLADFYKNRSLIIVYNASTSVITPTPYSEIYIGTKAFTKTFKPKCLPSIYTQRNKKFIVQEINIKTLIKKGDN